MADVIDLVNPFSSTKAEDAAEQQAEMRRKMAQAQLDKSSQLQQDLYNQTSQYRKNIPGMKESAFGAVGDTARQDFSRQLQSNNAAAQGRGLLYSGLKQQADQASAADYSTALSGRMASLNQGFNDQADSLEQMTLKNGMNLYQNQAQAQDAAYKNALAKQQQNGEQIGSLLGAAGKVGGLLVGGA